MNNKSRRRFVFFTILTVIFMYSFIGSKGEMVENEGAPVGIGMDLIRNGGGDGYYSAIVAVYEFTSSGDVTSRVLTGESSSMGETRDDRQRKSNKKFLLGAERVYVIGEAEAQYGIRNIIDILIENPQVNDKCPTIVFKGKGVDLLKYKMKGYASSAEYVEGMVKNSIYNNFFSNQFTTMDMMVRVDAEGRNLLLPYVELKKEGPQITGFAIFKGDKMIGKTSIQEARIINLLKFNGGKGNITIEKEPKNYIDYYAESKRKVECYKTDGEYKFVINIELKGSISSNELYPSLNKDPKVQKKFTKEVEDFVKKMCTEYINKAKYEYGTDILDLGREAAGKYGKDTGVDWNKIVCNSIIEVNVKAAVQDEGRGQY